MQRALSIVTMRRSDRRRQGGCRHKYHSPGKGQIRGSSGRTRGHLAGRGSRSKLGHGLGKKLGIPREKQHWPGRERLMEAKQEKRLTLLGTLSQMSCQDAAFSTPTISSSSQPNCPRPPLDTHTHTHSECSPHPAPGQRLPGSFPPITLPSLWKLIDGSNGDGQMLKLVWRLNSGCRWNIPRLSAPFVIHLDILENITSNWSGNNEKNNSIYCQSELHFLMGEKCSVTSVFASHPKEKENSNYILGISETWGTYATEGLQAWLDRKRTGFARHVVAFNYKCKCNRILFTHKSLWTASSRRHFVVFCLFFHTEGDSQSWDSFQLTT